MEFRFQPAAWNLQIVVWVEDPQGNVKATPYITRSTGQFGLGNRPGVPLLKTDCGWPYGRREMVFPVWAHRRNHKYPKIVMGGACGNAIESICPMGGTCGGNCDDSTIAYHGLVSSAEPYYCAPQGCVGGGLPDVVSCASPYRTLSKGAYLDPTMQKAWSLYPPRADITKVDPMIDSPDLADFARRNDLVAVSQATPRPGKPLEAPVYWNPQGLPAGDYVAFLEVSQEADFNASHRYPNSDDTISIWNQQGHPFLGQPSIVLRVPFHYDERGTTAGTATYEGYGAWDGQDGKLRPADGTITLDKEGSGLGRLARLGAPEADSRFAVVVGSCNATGMDGGTSVCEAPQSAESLGAEVAGSGTSLTVTFRVPAGVAASSWQVRYQLGSTPITDDNFEQQLVGPTLAGGKPGDALSATISNLMADSGYQVAVRGVSACGARSKVVSLDSHTAQMKFTTLSGCFVATAAWGSPLERHVGTLRAFRDRALLPGTAGQLFVAGYYAFGPSLAAAIAPDDHLRALARRALEPLAAIIANNLSNVR